MSLLDEIFARAQQNVNPALLNLPDPEMLNYVQGEFPAPRPPKSMTQVVAPPKPYVLPQMAAQAGILAPMASPTGTMPEPAPPAPAAPAPDVTDPESIPLPIPLPQPNPARLPAESSPTAGTAPPTDLITPAQKQSLAQIAPGLTRGDAPTTAMPSSPFGGSQILDRITNSLGNNSNTLLALAAGFAGAPNIGQGISRAAAAAIPARAADQKNMLATQGRGATIAALLQAGVPMQLAVAAQANPEIMKKITDTYIVDRKNEIKEIKSKDAFGNETTRLVAVNPYDLTSKDISGGGAGQPAAGGGGMLAPGVTEIDHTKVGPEYLAQYSPEIQAGVKAYMRGDSLPTGKPQLAMQIKTIGQKYGDDIGVPVNDQLYAQRKIFSNSLGDTRSGVGMQAKGFQQGLQHAVDLSDKLVKLGNYNGLGLEDVARGTNAVRNRTTAQQDILHGVATDSQALSGEFGKLNSGASGGGVHERETMQKLFGDPNMSGPAAAGTLESAIGLMEGSLRTLEQRRDALFPGEDKPRGSEFHGKAEEEAIAHIKKNISILRGEQQAEAAKTTTAVKPGAYVWTPQGLVPK